MATTPASGRDHYSIPVDPTAHADDAAGGEVRPKESSADMVRKLKILDMIVFCVAFLEWSGNAVGTLASLWATVVLLGGFCSLLSRKDFWYSTVLIFFEATRFEVPLRHIGARGEDIVAMSPNIMGLPPAPLSVCRHSQC